MWLICRLLQQIFKSLEIHLLVIQKLAQLMQTFVLKLKLYRLMLGKEGEGKQRLMKQQAFSESLTGTQLSYLKHASDITFL